MKENLEDLVDAIAQAINDKHHYEIVVNNRLRRYGGTASTWDYLMTGRRRINISGKYLEHVSDTNLIKTITHEIAHFKAVEKYRKAYLRKKHGSIKLGDINALYRARHRRPHTNSFWRLYGKLIDQVEIVYGEPLGRLTCNFCKFAGQRKVEKNE